MRYVIAILAGILTLTAAGDTLEAEQFFKAAMALPYTPANRETILAKLDAAIALAPDEQKYRVERYYVLYKELGGGNTLDDYLAILEPLLKTELKRDSALRDTHWRIIWLLRAGPLEGAWEKASTGDRRRLVRFCDRFRKLHYGAIAAERDLSSAADTLGKLENRIDYLCNTREFQLYFDTEEFRKDVCAGQLEALRLSAEYLRNHPDTRIPNQWAWRFSANWCMRRDASYRGITYTFAELEEYLAAAEKHPLSYVRALGLAIRLDCQTRESNYDSAVFRKNFTAFAREFARLDIARTPDSGLSSYLWHERLQKHPELRKTADEIARKYLPGWARSDAELFIDRLMGVKDRNQLPQFVLDHRQEFIRYEHELRHIPLGDGWSGSFADVLRELVLRYDLPRGGEALDFFNRDMTIKKVQTRSKSGWNTDAIPVGNTLYIVENHFSPSGFRVTALDMERDTLREIRTYPTELVTPCRTFRDKFSNGNALDCDGKLLAIGARDAVHLLRLDGSEGWTVTDLPDAEVTAVALLGERLYVWCGQKPNSRRVRILFSCALDGSDRKYHFNSLAGKDLSNSFCTGMLPDRERNRLLLLTLDELIEFLPETEKCRVLMKKPPNTSSWGESIMMQHNGDKIMVSFGAELMIFDPVTDESEWFFTCLRQHSTGAKHYFNSEPDDSATLGGGQFLINGSYLWIAVSGLPACVEMSPGAWRQIRYLLPYEEPTRNGTSQIFMAPDGKSIYNLFGGFVVKYTPRGTNQ